MLNSLKRRLRLISLFISVLVMLFGYAEPLLALSPEQKKVLQSGAYYFNTARDNQAAVGGSSEGCISAKLPNITDENAFAAAMTAYVSKTFPKSPFLQISDFGKIMVDMGKSSGVNPMLVIAIGAQESGMGQDQRSGGINQGTHNSFGMTASKGDPGVTVGHFTWLVFPSFEASLTADNGVFARLKSNGYLANPNVATFDRIINRWLTGSPDGKADIAGNTSSSYVKNATQTINNITSQPNAGVNCSGGSASGGSIVSVAQAELALNVYEKPAGSNCLPMVQNKYMGGICQSWCANFVSWVYMTAGKPFSGGSSGGWRLPGVAGVYAWFKANANWYNNEPGVAAPQPGDVIIFSYSGANADNSGALDHTGIIETVNGTTLTTIEGNASNRVKRNTYTNYPSSNQIVGWGRLK